MKKIIFLFTIFASFILISFSAQAQELTKVTVSPPRLEFKVKPGSVIQKAIKVHNGGDSELGLAVKVQDFIVSDDRGTPIPVKAKVARRWAASTWIQASPSKFILRPGETKVVDIAIVVPEKANPGGHYAVVFFQPAAAAASPETASAIMPSVGTLFYLTVPGPVKENAFVVRMEAPTWQEYGPVKIVSEVENLSDIHIRPRGTIRIYDWLGRPIATLKLKEQNIFPNTVRRYENVWQQHWGLGRYRATLSAGYGQQGRALTATIFFWIIPWHLILTIILLLLVIAAVIIWLRRRRLEPAEPKGPTPSQEI